MDHPTRERRCVGRVRGNQTEAPSHVRPIGGAPPLQHLHIGGRLKSLSLDGAAYGLNRILERHPLANVSRADLDLPCPGGTRPSHVLIDRVLPDPVGQTHGAIRSGTRADGVRTESCLMTGSIGYGAVDPTVPCSDISIAFSTRLLQLLASHCGGVGTAGCPMNAIRGRSSVGIQPRGYRRNPDERYVRNPLDTTLPERPATSTLSFLWILSAARPAACVGVRLGIVVRTLGHGAVASRKCWRSPVSERWYDIILYEGALIVQLSYGNRPHRLRPLLHR